MWRDIVHDLRRLPTAVVTVVDAGGYPLSVRCRPVADPSHRALRLDLPSWVQPRPGPAGLLGHSHNERLWALESFGVRGTLERRDGHWMLVPSRHVPGMGKGGLLGFLRLTRSGRKRAAAYLHRRDLPRPTVSWEDFDQLKQRLQREPAP